MHPYKYHIFIAHSATDRSVALELYQALSPLYQIFLDSESLLPGDHGTRNWQKLSVNP